MKESVAEVVERVLVYARRVHCVAVPALDDSVEMVIRTAGRGRESVVRHARELESFVEGNYEVYVKEVRPSGVEGKGTVQLQVTYLQEQGEIEESELPDSPYPYRRLIREDAKWDWRQAWVSRWGTPYIRSWRLLGSRRC